MLIEITFPLHFRSIFISNYKIHYYDTFPAFFIKNALTAIHLTAISTEFE